MDECPIRCLTNKTELVKTLYVAAHAKSQVTNLLLMCIKIGRKLTSTAFVPLSIKSSFVNTPNVLSPGKGKPKM